MWGDVNPCVYPAQSHEICPLPSSGRVAQVRLPVGDARSPNVRSSIGGAFAQILTREKDKFLFEKLMFCELLQKVPVDGTQSFSKVFELALQMGYSTWAARL